MNIFISFMMFLFLFMAGMGSNLFAWSMLPEMYQSMRDDIKNHGFTYDYLLEYVVPMMFMSCLSLFGLGLVIMGFGILVWGFSI